MDIVHKEITMEKYHSKVVESSNGKGLSLVATEDIPRGVIVEKFEGPIVKYAEVPKDMICHAIYVGEKIVDDQWVVSQTNAIRANHSCNPNCMIDDDLNIITIKPIKKDEELVYSYNLLYDEEEESDFVWDEKWNFECKCNSINCQKNIDRYVCASKLLP